MARPTARTNDLERRVYEHKHRLISGFTSRYNITRLVYFEELTVLATPFVAR